MERKYIVYMAKLDCQNNKKIKYHLAMLNELSIEELNDIWPGWTRKNILDSFLDIYKTILKASTKETIRKTPRIYKNSLLTESWITKQLNEWFSDGTLTETEKERIKTALFDVNISW